MKRENINRTGRNYFAIPFWLFLILAVVVMLRIPSLFEPYSYGDETIYLTLGNAIRDGVSLYSQVHDNKPPLLYLTAALAGNLFWFKAILGFWSIITIVIFWNLSKAVFGKLSSGVITSVVVFSLFTTIPLFEGNIANAELFMIGPTILGFLLLLRNGVKLSGIFLSGILFSIAALFKVPAFFDVAAIMVLWIFQIKTFDKTNNLFFVKKCFFLILGFLTPIIASFIWFYFSGSFKEYFAAAFLQNVGYLSSWRPEAEERSFIEKNLPLIVRFLIVVFGTVVLFIYRKKVSLLFSFSVLWLLFSLFGVTLSERPYPHYFVQSIAPISILVAHMISKKNVEQVLSIVPLTLAFFVPFYFRFWHYPTLPYYTRFYNFMTGNMSKTEYIKSFGENVNDYYLVSDFIKKTTQSKQKVFIWGEGSQVYALSNRFPPGKFVADYHIKDFSGEDELLNTLKKDPPVLIAVFRNGSTPYPSLLTFINENYAQLESFEKANIWKLLNPKIRLLAN